MRVPFYVGIEVGRRVQDAIPGPRVSASTAGRDSWEVVLPGATMLLVPVAKAKTRRIFSVLVKRGDQRYAWRYLRGVAAVDGPYTRHGAAKAVKDEMAKMRNRKDGEAGTVLVLAGEDVDTLDELEYVEGASEADDKVQKKPKAQKKEKVKR